MAVNRHQLMNELEMKLSADDDVYDISAEVADDVVRSWQRMALMDLDQGYATGEYVESIHRETQKGRHPAGTLDASGTKIGGRFWAHSRVVTYDNKAHFLEYGTGPDDAPNYPDPPNAGGHWRDPQGLLHFGWNTPTPIYAFAARVEMDYNATTAKLPKSKKARRRIRERG